MFQIKFGRFYANHVQNDAALKLFRDYNLSLVFIKKWQNIFNNNVSINYIISLYSIYLITNIDCGKLVISVKSTKFYLQYLSFKINKAYIYNH